MKSLMDAMTAGWQQYTQGGMYIGLYFAAMLFLWLVCYDRFKKNENSGKRMLFLYAFGVTVLVLFPLSAFVLLKYQSAFFTYSQLFLLIPMLPVMAWGMTELLTWFKESFLPSKEVPGFVKKRPWLCEIVLVSVLGFILWMAGSLSAANHVTTLSSNQYKIPEKVLEVLQVLETAEEIDLEKDIVVAPDEVLEYARAYSGELKLLYGRNMWQPELNAYTYDTYNGDLQKVHYWLNSTVYGLFGVNTEISSERAFQILDNNQCTVLVLTHSQVAEEEISGLAAANGYVEIGETDVYVILKK